MFTNNTVYDNWSFPNPDTWNAYWYDQDRTQLFSTGNYTIGKTSKAVINIFV